MGELDDRWERMLAELSDYRAGHVSVDAPRSYVTSSGRRLGAWLHRQRALAAVGTLPPDRRERLNQLDIQWVLVDREAAIKAFRVFVRTYGHGLVPHMFRTTDGMALGVWVQSRRQQWRSNPVRTMQLWPELDEMGFVWVVRDLAQQWETGLQQLQAYRRARGNTLVPLSYVTTDGFALGRWVDTRRTEYRAGTLSKERVTALDDIRMVWRIRATPDNTARHRSEQSHFLSMLRHTVAWRNEHNGELPAVRDSNLAGVAVGRWLGRQRHLARQDTLEDTRRSTLNNLLPGWSGPSAHTRPPK